GSRQTRNRCGNHEHRKLVAFAVKAKRNCPRLVFADRLKDLPEGRIDSSMDDKQAGHKNDQHYPVERQIGVKVDEPKELAARDGLNSVFAPGEFGLERYEINH